MSDPYLPAGVSQREIDGPADAEPTFAQHVLDMTPAVQKFLAVFEDDEGEDLLTELAQCAVRGPGQRLAFVNKWLEKLEQRWESRRQPVATPDVEEPDPFEQF